jgi:Rab-like protein 5
LFFFNRKVLVVGPAQSGKTRAVNTLAAISTQGVYDPTVGCRIIELERPLSVRDAKSKKEMQVVANVELWDLSGDVKYESCWPACQKDAHGVILVLEALQLTVNETAPEKSLDFWFQSFAARMGLDPSQVFVMVLGTDEQSVNSQVTSAGKLKLGTLLLPLSHLLNIKVAFFSLSFV